MKKIAFRHVPFSNAQREELSSMAASAGYVTSWLSDSLPTIDEVQDCEVLMGYFPPELMRAIPHLKWVQTPSAGVEKYCRDIYASPDVVLTNCSGAFGVAIAEYMLTGILMLMRLMPAYMKNQQIHAWQCMGMCRSIQGSRITVVGMGDIGTSFAQRAKALGAYVRGVRRSGTTGAEWFDEVFTADQLCVAVENTDAVVLCLPGTAATTGLISSEVFAHMNCRTIVCNCGRGYTVDQTALTAALREGRIAGAVLDVFEQEPLDAASPLWDMPNVILTPHISGHDDDPINAEAIFGIFKENLRRYLVGELLTHVVDRQLGY